MSIRARVKRVIPPALHLPLLTIVTWFRRAVLKRFRLARGPHKGRKRGLAAELAHWEQWFDREDVGLSERLSPALTDPAVITCLARIPRESASIVDVGAGPLSTLGTQAPGKQVLLTAVDPLADEYARILQEHSLTPPVKTEKCSGEELLGRFGPARFDIAFAENALDHSVDPLPIVENMLAVVKIGGFVVLRHNLNEADRANYGYLHQWNFREEAGHCIIWRAKTQLDLGAELGGRAFLRSWTEDGSDGMRHVVCIIEKK